MTISLKHKFHNNIPDGPNHAVVRPSNWNDEHDLLVGSGMLLGRSSPGDGPVEEIPLANFPQINEFHPVALSGDYDDLANKPTLGTAAAADTGDFATAAQGALADTALQPADIGVSVQGYSAVLAATTASFLSADETKLDGIEVGADVTDATNVNAAGAVMESDYDANTILAANSDNTPLPLTIAEARLVGRSTGGNIAALDASASRTILGLATGDSPQFTGIELGHASANTLTAASGVLSIEGVPLAFRDVSVNAQTGTTYTLALSDAGGEVTMNNGSSNTLTIPTNTSIAFPVNTTIIVRQLGSGATIIDGDTGVTVNGVSGGQASINARYQGAALLKVATDTWVCSGAVGTFA